ncbi:MAG: HK97 family phage prohead protease [Brevundimonas mediterranea]|uniref:HK97 family phage prohead protease n=1 Tax=Brevundimonas mediterranea TaxID=74329 RepID=UPI0040340477
MTIEYRDFAITGALTQETRDADGKTNRVEGHAAMFNKASHDLGGFREFIAPGAFKRSLDEASKGERNVFAVWSHDMSQPLGSTGGGKLTLEEDDTGLRFSLDPKRLTPAQLDAVADGEIRMSFGFMVREQSWVENDDGTIHRTLHDVDLIEISPVVSPAYPDTSAALRSLDAFKAERSMVEETVEEVVEEEVEEEVPQDHTNENELGLRLRLANLS